MRIFEFIPEEIDDVKNRVRNWLHDYSPDADKRIIKYLSEHGFDIDEILIPLALTKSKEKYGYSLDAQSLHHIVQLADQNQTLRNLIKDWPFMLTKFGFIYEHASTFIFRGEANSEDIDDCILQFAANYTEKYLFNQVNLDLPVRVRTQTGLSPLVDPRQVYMTTFWDKDYWHPVEYIKKAYEKNIKGVEYAVGFHPFNLNKLLPEEISSEIRQQIRQASEKLNVKLTIHTAVVGPYTTPNFEGTQLFYDPADMVDLHKETIILARDIGASSITLHLIDPERIQKIIEIIEFAKESGVYVALENYYHTGKIKQTSKNFIELMDLIVFRLPERIKRENFGITFDLGHYNIEGEDPIISAVNIGKWCNENSVDLTKIHATTNYGSLDYFPPNFSADVYDPVSYRGINNKAIIQLLRALGHNPEVVAEQISPLREQDIQLIDSAMRAPVLDSYEKIIERGNVRLISQVFSDNIIKEEDLNVEAYNFIAGIEDIEGLREYLIYRRVQNIEGMTSETAQEVTSILMRTSLEEQEQIIEQLESLLDSAINAVGGISRASIVEVCDTLSGVLQVSLTHERLNEIFVDSRIYQKGDVICEQGTVGTEMYYIKYGEVDVFLNDEEITTLSSGEIFGEMGVFGKKPRSATVKAATESEIGILSQERIITSIKGKSDEAKAVLYNLYKILPGRLRNLNDKYVRKIKSAKTIANLELSIEYKPVTVFDVEPIFGFDIFNYDELAQLFDTEEVYKKDEVVFEENSESDTIYFVKNGMLDVIRHKDVDTIVIAKLTKGCIFGEMSLIDNSKRSAAVISLDESRLGYISKEEFNKITGSEETDRSYKLLLTLCSTMLSRIARLNEAYMNVQAQIGSKKQQLHQNLWKLK